MDPDRISILLAVYNGETYLNELMDSVLNQVNVNIFEIIVIDDCSTDGSFDLIKGYQERHSFIKLIKNEKNIGPIGSFIAAARLATGDYMAFADQDDIWMAEKLSLSLALIKQMQSSKLPALIFTDLKMIAGDGSSFHQSFWRLHHIKPAKNNFLTILFSNIATGCTMLINREMLKEFISMPLNAEMHDHWMMLIAASFGAWKFLDTPTVLYRVHQRSVTDKRSVPFRNKLINFFNVSLNKNSGYLEKYMEQAKLFKQQYRHKLDEQANARLDYFIDLQHSSGLSKKVRSRFRFLFCKWM